MRYSVPIAGALFAVLMAGDALAGPREDTLAGISRCAGIGDNRTYLDCIYGATQPLRASLGLPPALPNQLRLVPPAPMAYQPPPSAVAAPPAAATPPAQPGLLGRIFGSGGPPGLSMKAYTFDKRGLLTVTLSDGEVWQQVATDTAFAQLGGEPSDYEVSIVPNQSGSADMDIKGETGTFRVQRLH